MTENQKFELRLYQNLLEKTIDQVKRLDNSKAVRIALEDMNSLHLALQVQDLRLNNYE